MSNDKQFDFEETDIEIADNKVGMLLKVISVILVTASIAYFVHFIVTKDNKQTKDKPQPVEPAAVQTQQEK